MELRQVEYFLGVARAGTFGRASDELHVAKSALSKQLKLLEDELGADLMLRGPGRREVELTPAGEAFLEEAVTIAEAVCHGRDRVRALSGPVRGQVRMVVAQGWDAWPGWSEMVVGFRRQYPELTTKVTQSDSIDRILTTIASGDADVAVLADLEVPEPPGLRVELLAEEPLYVMTPPEHPLAGREQIALADLRDEHWVLQPIEHALLDRAAAAQRFRPLIADDAPTPAMVRSLILAGRGIGICGRSERGFYEPVAALEIIDPPLTASIMLAYRTAYRSAATRAARDFLRSCFGL
jgi:LysR family transcriptional activator of glutamate synthase operon